MNYLYASIGVSLLGITLGMPNAAQARGPWYEAGDQTRARQVQLEKFDVDKDGKLSPSEREAMMKARREAVLTKYDADRNGRLDLTERKKWAADRSDVIFARLDTNKDRKITTEEAQQASGRRGRRFSRKLHRIDIDQDGEISAEELEIMLVRRPLPGTARRGFHKGFRGRHKGLRGGHKHLQGDCPCGDCPRGPGPNPEQ